MTLSIIGTLGKGGGLPGGLTADGSLDGQMSVPVALRYPEVSTPRGRLWIFRNKFVRVDEVKGETGDEIIVRVKHLVLSAEKSFENMVREIELFETLQQTPHEPRVAISEEVQFTVWRRDGGRCVNCGTQVRLEFDHIIPVSKGGSSTVRNIQLLCELCNRDKGAKI